MNEGAADATTAIPATASATVQGSSLPELEVLADVLQGTLAEGSDLGASVAVTIEGELVADFWGGWRDEARTMPWQSDTITNVWSTTKTMTSLTALLLVERQQLDVFEKVATYWPEFAANGKGDIEVRHLMSHTSGVSGWERLPNNMPPQTALLYDWDSAVDRLAAQAPWWEPGTASGYHALNQGHLVGEVIRRIDGRTLGQVFAQDIAKPLGLDFHIGLAAEHDHRVANVVPPPAAPVDLATLDPESPAVKTLTGPAPDAAASWTEPWRRAEIGAANGHGNARSVALGQALIANNGRVGDVGLLSPETINLIFNEQSNGPDLVLIEPRRFGIGYGLGDPEIMPHLPPGRVCYWGGWGGSQNIVDCDRRVTISYVMNKMLPSDGSDTRGEALISASYAAMKVALP